MKRFILALLAIFVASTAFAQTNVQMEMNLMKGQWTTCLLDSTETDTIFVIFPSDRLDSFGGIDTVAASVNESQVNRNAWVGTGDVFLTIIPETGAAEESDSLYAYFKPYAFNGTKDAWYVIKNDSTFAVFNTQNEYVDELIHYLNWTSGVCYGIQLSNELWSCGGFIFVIGQKAFNTAVASSKIYVGVHIVY